MLVIEKPGPAGGSLMRTLAVRKLRYRGRMKIGNITFDCADPGRLARFWAAVFGYPAGGSALDAPEEFTRPLREAGLTDDDLASRGLAEDPSGVGPRFYFHRVPEPKIAKNRMHLDLNVGDGPGPAERHQVDAEVERLVGLGATVIRKHDSAWGPWPEYHYVLADPEGNEFCVQ
jgi:catechol 2,3-dioxygenase-like lactoylglutathione lyase family enzyme